MHETKTNNPIISGVIWKQLLIFFFPIVVGTFFQQLYNTVDAIIVGRFVGKQALASVGGSAAVLSNLVIGFFTGLSAGATVVISQFCGAGDKKKNARRLTYCLCLRITVRSHDFHHRILLRLLGTPGDEYSGRRTRGFCRIFENLLLRNHIYIYL